MLCAGFQFSYGPPELHDSVSHRHAIKLWPESPLLKVEKTTWIKPPAPPSQVIHVCMDLKTIFSENFYEFFFLIYKDFK